jgi:glutamine cyclotransferase
MSDSSSVDRWHPSNVEDKRIDINDGIVWRDAEGRDWVQANRFREKVARIEELEQMRRTLHANHEYKDARIAELEADRGRVLAAARELAEAAEHSLSLPEPPGAELDEAARAFREVDQ